MNKLKSLLNSYFWLIALGFLVFIGVLIFSTASGYQESSLQKTVGGSGANANKALNEAGNANTSAANFEVNRRTEDVIRERIIQPKLGAARKNSNNSKTEVEKAKRKLNETNKNLHNANVSRAADCLELKKLFPNETFAYCQ